MIGSMVALVMIVFGGKVARTRFLLAQNMIRSLVGAGMTPFLVVMVMTQSLVKQGMMKFMVRMDLTPL